MLPLAPRVEQEEMEAVKVEFLEKVVWPEPSVHAALIFFVCGKSVLFFTCIQGIIGVRNRLPVIFDLVIVEQHKRWNAAQSISHLLLAQPCFVRQPISIIFSSRIVESGGGIDIHLV